MTPRVLVLLRSRWPRALLRAQLIERGFEAFAAPSIAAALPFAAARRAPAPLKLIVLDQRLIAEPAERMQLDEFRARHRDPPVILVANGEPPPDGPWAAVVPSPFSNEKVLREVGRILRAVPQGDGVSAD